MKDVADQYEAWPYPNISYFARVPKEQLWQINYAWLASRAGQKAAIESPRIWIAGCGTFQPYVFSQANPNAKILATDISQASLSIAKKRCVLHGNRNIQFKQVDLSDENSMPTEKFDLIECYGVLMCLADPAKALKAMVARLKPTGILRLMVYPHYGRQRIFQIQRMAKLLGLNHQEEAAPLKLYEFMKRLPEEHPLNYAFFSYQDSKTEEGIVDAFLHAKDRAFTGIEISQLVDEAGLDLAYCMHRPWGQPRLMAERLGLLKHDPALWLHYLDLWQSLKTNFILVTVPKDREAETDTQAIKHPLFSLGNSALKPRDKARLLRMAFFGTKLESRTHEKPIGLSGKDVRNLLVGNTESLDSADEVLPRCAEPILGPLFQGTSKSITANSHFSVRLGEETPNPLYAYLFDAFTFQDQWNPLLNEPLGSLREQIRTWRRFANPMEDDVHRFGLTPFGTYEAFPEEVDRVASRFPSLRVGTFNDLHLQDECQKFGQIHQFLKESGFQSPAEEDAMRELWFLLFSYKDLFVKV